MTDSQKIYDFVSIAIESGGWMELDRVYLQNKICDAIGVSDDWDAKKQVRSTDSKVLCQDLLDIAMRNSCVDSQESIEVLARKLYDVLTPPPSVVNALFAKKFEDSPVEATNYLYWLNQINQYLKGSYLEGESNECPICMSQEGKSDLHSAYLVPSRRMIHLNLDGESWGFQFFPSENPVEEGLFFREEHAFLELSEKLFGELLQLIGLFDHYQLRYDYSQHLIGHGYIKSIRPKKIEPLVANHRLSFFNETQLACQDGQLFLKGQNSFQLKQVFSYVLSLNAQLNETNHLVIDISKSEGFFQIKCGPNTNSPQVFLQIWQKTLDLLEQELEVFS